MFSVLSALKDYIFATKSSDEPLLINSDEITNILYACDPNDESSKEIEHCVGTVTSISGKHGYCNDKYIFDYPVPGVRISVGDRVSYQIYRNNPNEEWRVLAILGLDDSYWGSDKPYDPVTDKFDERGWKKIVGKVTKVNNEGVVIAVGDTQLDFKLCDIKAGFDPVRGDWLQLELNDINNVASENVVSVKPLRSKTVEGRITHLYDNNGVINKEIAFDIRVCSKFKPQYYDAVFVEAIESHQGTWQWRALSVTHNIMAAKRRFSKNKPNTQLQHMPLSVLTELLVNKENITITCPIEFDDIPFGEIKMKEVVIRNTGDSDHALCKIEFSSKHESQFGIVFGSDGSTSGFEAPSSLDLDYTLQAVSEVHVKILCFSKNIGKCREMCIFSFKGFNIGRYIDVNVKNIYDKDLVTQPPRHNSRRDRNNRRYGNNDEENMRIPGVRLVKPAFFTPNRLPMYPVPNDLLESVLERRNIVDYYPCLAQNLREDNYIEKFDALLHLEEIALTLNMQQYDMERVVFQRKGDYLALTIPGLAEKRPSLLLGDRVVARDPWGDSNIDYEGFIHEICCLEVYIKFHDDFHLRYDCEDYNVSFFFSRTPLRRCHLAVETAFKQLGPDFLFPTEIQPLPPQVKFIENETNVAEGESSSSDDSVTDDDCDDKLTSDVTDIKLELTTETKRIKSLSRYEYKKLLKDLSKKKNKFVPRLNEVKVLNWVNVRLNERQKFAVKRILAGEGRKLPYIIYGPPGTGKTVTVVEAVIQVFQLCNDSRILIATPSNSSADLLTSRLHHTKLISPGDMVRLNAFSRNIELAPEDIQAYCSNGDEIENIVRHRVLITTCISSGQLYTLGLKYGHFSHVFIDEAGYATEPECLIPIGLVSQDNGQVILAGDVKQLGPVLMSHLAKSFGLESSLLERLSESELYSRDEVKFREYGCYNPLLLTKLIVNYRSHPSLLHFPSSHFYDGELLPRCHPSSKRTLMTTLSSLPSPPTPLVFHGVNGQNIQEGDSPSWFNPAEVFHVVMYLKELYDLGLKPKHVGVITPYRKQVEKIRFLVDKFDLPHPKIGSVEEFQGQERLAIILSTVRSCEEQLDSDKTFHLGFIFSPKRMNVSITRCKGLLIVIGNPHVLSKDPLWNDFLDHCVKQNLYKGCDLPLHLQQQQ